MQRTVAQGIRNQQRQQYEAQAVVVGALPPALPLEVFSAVLPDAVRRYRYTMWTLASLDVLIAVLIVYSAMGLPWAPLGFLQGENVAGVVGFLAALSAVRVATTYIVRKPWGRVVLLVTLLLHMAAPFYWLIAGPLFVEVLQPRVASWFQVRHEVVRALI